ncbi:MAG: succinyl-diaminopimelate desuccinylase [Actinomycetota bacterium]|nr:succinyl-diaminopimelate desuccinylase [Actinomycetota bacterium]
MASRSEGTVGDLLALAASLVATESVSHREQAIADRVQAQLCSAGHLEVLRIGDSVVARTSWGLDTRVLLAGHLDTVPPSAGQVAGVEGDVLWGLGAVDMKGGLAVLLDLAADTASPAVDTTFVLYACEEVARRHNALAGLAVDRPDLLRADAAILAEPTGGVVEAGCQGTLRAELRLRGRRAHSARPWTGVNAIHRLAPALCTVAAYHSRQVVLDGCAYTEQLQAVGVGGGVAGNVVPDEASLTVNFRFAPDRTAGEAEAVVRQLLAGSFDPASGDELAVVDVAGGAPPSLAAPVLAGLVAATGRPARAKVGWTDVATLAGCGVPATNYGPGDPALAHTADEHVSRAELDEVRRVLAGLLFI